MNNALLLRLSAVLGFLAVALGAFGAHGLKATLAQNGTAAIWDTAVFYHFVHVIVMFVLGLRPGRVVGPWMSFLIGILVFSGTLYLLAITNLRWLGAITPIGGVGFLVGWGWLVVSPPIESGKPGFLTKEKS